ncbi:prepilin peptidase [Enterobacter cloacae]|uniref:prepilin peptidase n=1 Tax=Enterobacter cloacae TaxID=550 RepID=UPI00352A8584
MNYIHNISVFSWLLYVLVGLSAGSFINVIVYRLPLMTIHNTQRQFNLCFPSSYCTTCLQPLRWFENIPLLSWLALKGKCRHCHQSISARYLCGEVVFMLITLLSAWICPDISTLIASLVFSACLLALSQIDIQYQLLPDSLTLTLLWVGLCWHLLPGAVSLSDAVCGAIAGYLSLWITFHLFRFIIGKEALGYGDFKLLAALGAWLGWQQLPLLVLIASMAGIAVSIMVYFRKGYLNKKLAFGPFLSLAGWFLFYLPYINH